MRLEKVPVTREFGDLRSDTRLPWPTPFLKWAGGKTQLLKLMEPFFPDSFDTYFEPFLGGGAVFFRLRPAMAMLSDSNPELVNVFRVVRDDPEGLMYALDRYHTRRREKAYYYRTRKLNPSTLGAVERAARTIFLNKTCYNGLYRVNEKGEFNVPFGRYKNPTLYTRDKILACSLALRGRMIDLADYRETCRYPKRGDFVYLDPPYQPVSATANFTAYTKDAFGEADQERLAEVFRDLDGRGCKVMLSNSATPLITKLYQGYQFETVKAMRPISSNGLTRGHVDEFLIMNYP